MANDYDNKGNLEVSFFIRTFAILNNRAQVECIKRLYNYGL